MLGETDDHNYFQQKKTGESSEHELLQRIYSGDGNASWELLERHTEVLYRCCLRTLGGDTEEAKDALGQIYLKAYEKLPLHVQKIKKPVAWLARLTQNECRDRLRKQGADKTMLRSLMLIENISPRCTPSPETLMLEKEGEAQILAAIETLAPRLHDTARLNFVENRSYIEITQQLSITAANARKRIQQARDILKPKLEPNLRSKEES